MLKIKAIFWGIFFIIIQGWVFAAPLPANEAFSLTIQHKDPNTFDLIWQIKPGYFLYKDRIKLKNKHKDIVHLGELFYPQASIKTDTQGKTYPVYRDRLHLSIPVLGASEGNATLVLTYQGCSDSGFCYPPEKKIIPVTINNQLALTDTTIKNTNTAEDASSSSSKDSIQHVFTEHNWVIIILLFWVFGLLLSFTPCVLPMIPVLSSIIIGQGNTVTTRKAFLLSLSYVLSMALTYALIGAGVSMLGSNLQILMQSPWAIGFFSIIFVLLALSMFGFYELKFPQTWQMKLSKIFRSQDGGHYLGAAIMGMLSTLILSPCVTAPLVGVLGYIASTGNIVFGMITLFVLGLGMGTPLLLIGVSANHLLPKAGAWMELVKSFFGVLLLGIAIYLISRITPALFIMGCWAALLIFSGIYYGALTKSSTSIAKFKQGLGIILLLYGILILIGASMGQENPIKPLANLYKPTTKVELTDTKVFSLDELQKAITQAKGKPIFIDFYADWCVSCKILENTTFQNSEVVTALQNFHLIKVDLTKNNANSRELLKRFNIVAPPTFIFYNAKGEFLPELTIVGEVTPVQLLQSLMELKS